jgi:hypothetical protein
MDNNMPDIVIFDQRVKLESICDGEPRERKIRGSRLRGSITILKTKFNIEAIAVRMLRGGLDPAEPYAGGYCEDKSNLVDLWRLSPGSGHLQTIELEYEGQKRDYVLFVTPMNKDDKDEQTQD